MSHVAVILGLACAFQLKHFVADYLLQTDRHLGKFKAQGWVGPLAEHCAVHAMMTLAVGCGFAVAAEWRWGTDQSRFLVLAALPLLDFVSHFVMDRVKASPTLMGRWKGLTPSGYAAAKADADYSFDDCLEDQWNSPPGTVAARCKAQVAAQAQLRGNKLFWVCLGLDQMWHHCTHYVIIALLLTA